MPEKRREIIRQRLFTRGAAALRAARPTAPVGYACPICLIGHSSHQPFTLEHVPPKSVGGRTLLLTCAHCNSTAGRELDVHIAAAASLDAVAKGEKPLDARFSFAGDTIATTVRLSPNNLDITAEPSRSNPAAHRRIFETFESAAGEKEAELTFQLSYRHSHDPWRETVAWLRVGYLYAFAMLGYNYILRPQLNAIREQIQNPDEVRLPYLVKRISNAGAQQGIHFILRPVAFRSIAVVTRDRFVVLPDFENPSTLIERLKDVPERSWPTSFNAKTVPLPSRPHYIIDFEPSLVRFLTPDVREQD